MAVTLYEESTPSASRVREYTEEPLAPEPPKKGRELRQELVRQLGLSARNFATLPTAVGGALADFGYGAANVGSLLTRGEPAVQGPPPSQQYQQALTQAGLPEASGPLEKVVEFFSQAASGGADPIVRGAAKVASKIAPEAFRPSTPATAQVAKELHNAGLKLEPAAVGGGMGTRALQGFGGDAHTAKALQNANAPTLQKLAAREVGLDPRNITDDALKAAAASHYKVGYEPIKQLGTIRTGKLYRDALDDIASKYHPKSFANKTTPELVEDLQSLRVGGFKSDEAINKIQQLRDKASDQFRGGDRTYGKALREMAKALEDQIERNVKNPELLANYKAARVELAKNYAVRDMLLDPKTGIIDSRKAAKMLDDGEKLTGGLATIAKAGGPLHSRATQPALHGEGLPINWGSYGSVALPAAAAVPFTGGWSLAALAGVPAAQAGARKAILSPAVQRALVNRMQGDPSIFGAPAANVAVGAQPEFADIAAALFPTFTQGGR